MGGVETLMARMSKWLTENGHEVSILCRSITSEMYDIYSDDVCIATCNAFERLEYKSQNYVKKLVAGITNRPVDVVVPFNPKSICGAVSIAQSLPDPCRLVTGVFGNNWYCNYSLMSIIQNPANLVFHEMLCSKSRMYMNKILQRRIEETSNRKVPGEIWPLPVDGQRFMEITRKPERGKIVSVNRLGYMKEFHIGMIDVVKNLVDEGNNVKWLVYGDGKYREAMGKKISHLGLKNNIRLMGNIDYEKMHCVLEDAWLFIGMGTAIIEASYAKIPSIAVIPYTETPTTYGYFHELPEFNVGEKLDCEPKDFFSLVKETLSANNETYEELGRSCFERAGIFNLEARMGEFMRNLKNIEPCRWKTKITLKYYIALVSRALLSFIMLPTRIPHSIKAGFISLGLYPKNLKMKTV